MNEPPRIIGEFVKLLTSNIELANSIGEQLNLPVDEALSSFQRDLIEHINTNAAYDRALDELAFVNEASTRNKQNFTAQARQYEANLAECMAKNKNYLSKLEVLRSSLKTNIDKSLQSNNNELTINNTERDDRVVELEGELVRRQEQLNVANAQLLDARNKIENLEQSARVGVSLILNEEDDSTTGVDEAEIKRLRDEIDILRANLKNNKYTELINNFITSNPNVRAQLILEEEIKRRDLRIAKLEASLKSIPSSELDKRLRAMSDERKTRLSEILSKYTRKIRPYDRSFSSKINSFMQSLDVEFGDIFDYIDTILTILTELNIVSIEKLHSTFDAVTLNDLQESLKHLKSIISEYEAGDGSDVNLSNLRKRAQTFLDGVDAMLKTIREGDSVSLNPELLNNRSLYDENLRSDYDAMVKELMVCRNETSNEQTRLIKQQLQLLSDEISTDAVEDDPIDPINYNILLNRLKLEVMVRERLRRAFKELTESKENELESLRKELSHTETELARVKSMNDSLSTRITKCQTKSDIDNEYIMDMLKYIRIILNQYTDVCKSNTPEDLTNRIKRLVTVMSSTESLDTIIARLKSISELTLPCIEKSRVANSAISDTSTTDKGGDVSSKSDKFKTVNILPASSIKRKPKNTITKSITLTDTSAPLMRTEVPSTSSSTSADDGDTSKLTTQSTASSTIMDSDKKSTKRKFQITNVLPLSSIKRKPKTNNETTTPKTSDDSKSKIYIEGFGYTKPFKRFDDLSAYDRDEYATKNDSNENWLTKEQRAPITSIFAQSVVKKLNLPLPGIDNKDNDVVGTDISDVHDIEEVIIDNDDDNDDDDDSDNFDDGNNDRYDTSDPFVNDDTLDYYE